MCEVVDVQKRLLEANDTQARDLRERFAASGTLVLNLISSPGSGKTTLLEATLRALSGRLSCAVLVGDVATERDAERLRACGVPARQILTGGACHLDARLVTHELGHASFGDVDVLFIENVGNLVCPADYDLGEDMKVALLSTTEGDDKVLKYPGIFSMADEVLVTKSDLLPYVTFDPAIVRAEIGMLNPKAEISLVSAKTGEGLAAWCDRIAERRAAKSHRWTRLETAAPVLL